MLTENLDLFSPQYTIIRSKRRTLGITVKDAKVEVRAPLKAPQQWIEDFIQEKNQWIEEKVYEQRQQQQEIYRLEHNATIPILDRPYHISLHLGSKNKICTLDLKQAPTPLPDQQLSTPLSIQLKATLKDELAKNKVLYKLFSDWLKQQADTYMTHYSRHVYDRLTTLLTPRVALKSCQYRITKSKWGHCTSEGVIQYNPLILLAPTFVVHYIVTHEICHLQHANHSKSYWRLVDKIDPNRVAAERWLADNGHKLALYKTLK